MEQGNLGVVLGPTLMRPKEETMAAIMGIKFQSLVVETMIREYVQVPATQPSFFNTCSKSTIETPEKLFRCFYF